MTQEQKARAYDEALERAKKVHKYSSDLAEIKRMEYIFSELAESEDDKIRNFISNELACLRATDGKGSDRYEELTNAIAWLEKQGETFTKKDVDDAYIEGMAFAKYELEKQKPAWSEEDEEFLRRAINATKDIYPMTANWLKSLKQRYTWKPSKEQLKFLQHYADQNNYDGTVLTSLLNDLKKL